MDALGTAAMSAESQFNNLRKWLVLFEGSALVATLPHHRLLKHSFRDIHRRYFFLAAVLRFTAGLAAGFRPSPIFFARSWRFRE